ncbi:MULTISPECIES: GIY-YIG nuclease family protein [unclassified Nodularia (in: cyanobacteria)]|uniref:GIY-YIG nuclease family protein n=1 Tax=unclassified Nodularia (in: cyanobacteria) TaxID=2656917 RepID=UPI00188105F6|nr:MULTISPECIES: GIY-YIG nuclease family protein [unclassified Nodularia (in: cyanobacteria)]MBE9199278.1 GIY-YIG nuclease family protein [Nodularia sp. LEGE 06071]MCC2693704.1 GIY-YIG nuclease family protein [Nodularia sp. LEGE 04288]
MESENNVPIEHQNVPVNHRGLHEFLYSSDDEHDTTEVAITPTLVNNGLDIMPLETWRTADQNAKIAGVYAVLDAEGQTQYIGYSRNVLLSLNGHVSQYGEEKCAFVRVQTFKFPKRQEMEDLRDAWIGELECTPPGNAAEGGMWASTVGEAAKAVMSEAERHAYEEKKLKLRKAMADSSLSKEIEAVDASAEERQRQLEAAVKNDDWSSVIDAQTKETKS